MELVKPFKAPEPEDEEFGVGEDVPTCSVCNQKIRLGETMAISAVGVLAYNRDISFYELSKPHVVTTHTRCED